MLRQGKGTDVWRNEGDNNGNEGWTVWARYGKGKVDEGIRQG